MAPAPSVDLRHVLRPLPEAVLETSMGRTDGRDLASQDAAAGTRGSEAARNRRGRDQTAVGERCGPMCGGP